MQNTGKRSIKSEPEESLPTKQSILFSIETISDSTSPQSSPHCSQLDPDPNQNQNQNQNPDSNQNQNPDLELHQEQSNAGNRENTPIHDTLPSFSVNTPLFLRFVEIGKTAFLTPDRVDPFQNVLSCKMLYLATSSTKQGDQLNRVSCLDLERGTVITSLELKEGDPLSAITCIPANSAILLTCGKVYHYYDARSNTIFRSILCQDPILRTSSSEHPYLMYI